MSKEDKKKKKITIIKHIAIRLFGLTLILTGILMFIRVLRWNIDIVPWQIFALGFLLIIIVVLVGIMYLVFNFDGWLED